MDQQDITNLQIKPLMEDIEKKLLQIRETIQDLLISLELQEHTDWTDMIHKFGSLSSEFSSLQILMRKSATSHQGSEDNIKLMKMSQLVPKSVSLEYDKSLAVITEDRLPCFSHNVVPILLRTKLKPEVEEDELNNERERSKGDVPKQIKTLNSHVDMLCTKLTDFTKIHVADRREPPSYSPDETLKLVRAVCLGRGIQPKPPSLQTAPSDGGRASSSQQMKSKS